MTAPLALVTGAPGWLGTRLVEALVEGLPDDARFPGEPEREVRCLVQPGIDTRVLERLGARVRILRGDVRDPAKLDGFLREADGATLFHAAGLVHPRWRTRELYEVNVDGTRNLLEAARRARVRRFIHVSSISPFGYNRRPEERFDESSAYRAVGHYGRSKQLAEELVRTSGLDTVVLRPPWFYGPHQPTRQTTFFRMIRDGRFPIVGDGSQRRSMAYVDNTCQALLLAERVKDAAGRAYFVADERPYSMLEIVTTVARVLERDFGIRVRHRRWRLPSLAAEVALAGDRLLQHAGLYEQRVHVLAETGRTIACDVGAAQRELGFVPRLALEEGMRRSVAWLVRNGGRI